MYNYSMMYPMGMGYGMGYGMCQGNVHQSFKSRYGVGPDIWGEGARPDYFECSYTPRKAIEAPRREPNRLKRWFNSWFR